jgi:predicted NAD/FAD-dependent oxidoreductase
MINKAESPNPSSDSSSGSNTSNASAVNGSIRSVAIIGSGLAGLTAAILLQNSGQRATIFEKSRGPGGRLAAKRVKDSSADVGAQYFTIRNPDFRQFLEQHAGAGRFAPWAGRFGYQKAGGHWEAFPKEERYVGVPRMTAISRGLAENVNVVAETRIHHLERNADGWNLLTAEGELHGPFDSVVITAPPAQARDLLADSRLPHLASQLDEPVRHVQPCWAVAAHFQTPPFQKYDGMRVHSDVLSWVANNSSKPGREDSGQWWVLHGRSDWSHANQDRPAEQVAGDMVREFMAITGTDETPDELVSHRWLYAKSSDRAEPGHLWFADEQIGLAGDWLSGGRVEGAFNSASSLVAALADAEA